MGKTKHAPAGKKPRVGGADISRFFDPRPGHPPQQEVQRDEAPPARRPSPQAAALTARDCNVAGIAAGPGPSPSPAHPAVPKHMSVLQDLVSVDSFAMSQDTDAMQVVWQDSPGSSSQPPARSLSNLGRPAGYGAQQFNAIKQRLISAAQQPRDVRRPGPMLAGSARMQQSEQFLEGLLARHQHQPTPHAAATAAQAPAAEVAAQEHSTQSGAPSEQGGPPAGGVHKTPGTHLRGILKRRGGGGTGCTKQTPASVVKFALNDSTSKAGRGRAGGVQMGSSGKKRQAGQKRKALLDLLDQVESIVQSGSTPGGGEEEASDAAGAEAETDGPGAVSDKENASGASGGSQGQAAPPAPGPTGSQQLMPPPGGLHCHRGQPQAAPPLMQQQQQQQQEQQKQAHGSGTNQPAAAAVARPQQASGPAGSVQASSVQQAVAAGSGGFNDGDEDEDDALMAQLELQLLTQMEQQQAAARQGHGPTAARQGHGPTAARQGHAHAAAGLGGPAAQPAAGRPQEPRQTVQAPSAPSVQLVPARPQAAPPAVQHPTQQQQQQQQVGPAKPLPRSPYSKEVQGAPKPMATTATEARPKPACALPQPQPAAGMAPAPSPAPPAPKPPTGPRAAATTGAQAAQGGGGPAGPAGSDGWGDDLDDLDMDVALLDQLEAAALKERADRSLQGEPSTSGSGGGDEQQQGGQQQQGPGVTEGEAQLPAQRGAGYPGQREEVHYQIKEIYHTQQDQVLLLYNKYKKRDVFAHLYAPWADLPYRVGDSVNVLAELDWFEGHYHCLLNMEKGMLILHPDVLLSGTRITTSHECPRRSFLDERVAGDGSNDKAVKGTLQHNLIQAALTEGLRTPQQLHAAAHRIVGDATEALLEVELSEEAALECLKQATPGILRWMHRFLRKDPAPDSLLAAGMDYSTGRDIRRMVAVQEVVDIEESIWSTKYGVKGMIDVSAQLALDSVGQQAGRPQQQAGGWMQQAGAGGNAGNGCGSGSGGGGSSGREVAVGPVEIKTGKMHDSHRAQVLLYLLLMEERYGKPLDWGMLWYTTQTDPQLVMKRPMDLSCLMAVRNRLAAAIAHVEMPPLSDEKRQCNWCFQQLNCALAHKAEQGAAGTADSFVRNSTDRGGNLDRVQEELAAKYERATSHMSAADCEFLKKWEKLVTLEEGHGASRRPEVWAMAGEERQQLGRCMAGLTLSHVDEEQLLYTFCRPEYAAIACNFQEGEMLLLSVEGQHVAVARGFFYTCTSTHLTISLNKALRRGLLKPCGTPPKSLERGAAGGAGAGGGAGGSMLFDPRVQWRLDRDDVSSTFVRLRGNLYSLFRREFDTRQDPETRKLIIGQELPESQHAAKLRRLIVDLAAPQYEAEEGCQADPTPAGMNSEQHEAVGRVLRARDYTLVLGMPGAGKTTTIISMVQALVAQGKSVLLTSYTNSAVDNILMKLAREEVPFVRLGREAGVHPAIRPWVPGGERYPQKTTRELARLAGTIPVFGATCFGVNHAMLKNKLFDVCIVDEAGQIVLPACLGPLLKARSFVLVGDHNQLPPLVASREAEAGGLGESLFKRLSDAHPQAVVSLPVQYRMAADIMLLPNALIYNNALRCGTDGIAQAALELPPSAAAVLGSMPPWVQAALQPQRRVLFLDTSQVEGARETMAGDALSNRGEAQLVLHLLQAAAAAGVAQEQVGLISPFRPQVALLDRLCRESGLGEVEVLTVDKCQGRDKDCCLISLVRSNATAEAGKLLADWRRINVAITRAKKKLVLVGDAATLKSIPLFGRLVALVQQHGWFMSLPPDTVQQLPHLQRQVKQ